MKLDITRADGGVTTTRQDTPNFSLFKYVNGKRGRTLWNLGYHTRRAKAYAVDTDSKVLCSGSDMSRDVQLLGKGTFSVRLFDNVEQTRNVPRSEVPAGSVFIIPGSKNSKDGNPTLYAAIGVTKDNEYVSVNLATQDTAFGSGDSTAKIVGTFSVDAVEAA